MARSRSFPAMLLVTSAILACRLLPTFVPPPPRFHGASVGASIGALGLIPAALASPLEDAALKLADTSYPRVAVLLGKEKGKLADVVSKVISETNYDVKVASAADKAVEALLVSDPAKAKATFQAIDAALDAAVAKNGLVPPLDDVKNVAKAVAGAVESGGGGKFKEFIDAVAEQGSVPKVFDGLGFDAAAKEAFSNFISVAAATEATGGAAAGAAAAPTPELTAAAIKFADASYPIVETLNKIGGKTIAPVAGKAIGIAFSGDAGKVGKAADTALEALISTNFANAYEVLGALDKALDAAVANGGLIPPKTEVEGVAQAIAGALATVGPGKLGALLPQVVDAANSADKFKILGILGDGGGLVAKINPGDVTAATAAALDLAKASGAQ